MPETDKTLTVQVQRAPRGPALSCLGWQQEGVLRMLLNSLDPDVAEKPRELLLSGAAGKTAADAESLQAITAALPRLHDNQSLLIRSGKLSEVTNASSNSPLVSATNPETSGPERGVQFADWLFAGTQTTLPLLYEIYADAAQRHFGGTLVGKLVLGAGMGGAGGVQPLAATLHGAAFLGIDIDAERIKRRVKTGYCEVMVNHLDEALRMLKNAVRQRKAASIGLIGDCSELFPALAARGVVPDLLTDYTPGPRTAAHTQGVRDLERLGTRALPLALWPANLPASEGWRFATWIALSGERSDIARVDELALQLFPSDARIQRWLPLAAKFIRFQGLPARVAWLQQSQLAEFGRAINDLVAQQKTSAPMLLGWHSANSEPDAASSQNRANWTWSAAAAAPGATAKPRSAQAIVADGSADAADRFSCWR